jgi:23S rRNA pseudouridine1911/1915/1917 synthase
MEAENKSGRIIYSGNERYFETIIERAYCGKSVHYFLKHRLHFSESMIRRRKFIDRGICVNHRMRFVNYILKTGDVFTVRLVDKGFIDKGGQSVWFDPPESIPDLDIVYEDDDIIVIDKDSGICCHPSPGHYSDTISNQLAVHLGIKEGKLFPVGRLDKDTSGLVTWAKNSDAAAILTYERTHGIFEKTYLAEVQGIMDDMDIVGPIRKTPGEFMHYEVHISGRPAITHIHVLERDLERNRSLIKIMIEHGRTHQIRVHLAYKGHPIIGDPIYNHELSDETMKLKAYKLAFRKVYTGEKMFIESKKDF